MTEIFGLCCNHPTSPLTNNPRGSITLLARNSIWKHISFCRCHQSKSTQHHPLWWLINVQSFATCVLYSFTLLIGIHKCVCVFAHTYILESKCLFMIVGMICLVLLQSKLFANLLLRGFVVVFWVWLHVTCSMCMCNQMFVWLFSLIVL